jgi:hypothetical protein
MRSLLLLKRRSRFKPPFKLVVFIATEVKNNHESGAGLAIH